MEIVTVWHMPARSENVYEVTLWRDWKPWVYHGIRNHGHVFWQSHWNGKMLVAKIHQETRTLCTFDMRATVRFTGVKEKESMVI
jgi:hypothetical protein